MVCHVSSCPSTSQSRGQALLKKYRCAVGISLGPTNDCGSPAAASPMFLITWIANGCQRMQRVRLRTRALNSPECHEPMRVACDATTCQRPARRMKTSVNRSSSDSGFTPPVRTVVRPVTIAALPNARIETSSIFSRSIGGRGAAQACMASARVMTAPVMWMTDHSGANIAPQAEQSPAFQVAARRCSNPSSSSTTADGRAPCPRATISASPANVIILAPGPTAAAHPRRPNECFKRAGSLTPPTGAAAC